MKLSKIAQAIITATLGGAMLIQASLADSGNPPDSQTDHEGTGIDILFPDDSGLSFFTPEQEQKILKHRKRGRVSYSEVRIGQPGSRIVKDYLDENNYGSEASEKDYNPVLVTGNEDWRPDPVSPAEPQTAVPLKPPAAPAAEPEAKAE